MPTSYATARERQLPDAMTGCALVLTEGSRSAPCVSFPGPSSFLERLGTAFVRVPLATLVVHDVSRPPDGPIAPDGSDVFVEPAGGTPDGRRLIRYFWLANPRIASFDEDRSVATLEAAWPYTSGNYSVFDRGA